MNDLRKLIRASRVLAAHHFFSYLKRKDSPSNDVFLSSRRLWVRLGSLYALAGYIGQLGCQFLITGSLWLAQVSPLRAMERDIKDLEDSLESRSVISKQPDCSRPPSLPLIHSGSFSGPSIADASKKNLFPSTRFYKDSAHLLTHEFWQDRDLSDRLKPIIMDIEKLKENIINYKIGSTGRNKYLERYKKFFKCSEGETNLALIGCNLHFMSEKSIPENLEPQYTPAIVRLEDHAYNLLVNTLEGVKLIPAPEGINLNDLDAYFQIHHVQNKQFLAWNHFIMRYITSKGGHHPLIPFPQGQIVSFSIKNIKGGSGCDLTILSHAGRNLIAIKNFNDIEEGLNELLSSLVALDVNTSPQELKMARIYDAILYPENCLNLIMEGANTHVIHYYLSTDLAESVIKACAKYFAQFHLRNYKNKYIDRGRYIKHVARAARTLKGNPLKGKNQEKPALHLLRGKQWTENNLKDLQSSNIIRLLSEQEQENFAHLVKSICDKFEDNCNKIFRTLKAVNSEEQEPYFLTLTHGDAHGNNFFYNDEKKINDYEISKDSYQRITMIDVGKVARTYGDIGDPAEDVGRFIGSLWDWFFLQDYRESEGLESYKKIEFLQNQFIYGYLRTVQASKIFSTAEKYQRFEQLFMENCNFYKLRFYRAIFNFIKDKDKRKDKEIKIKVLRSWMAEKVNLKFLSPDQSQSLILKKESKNRPWKPVKGEITRCLPDRILGFIESAAKGSDKSYLTLLWESLHHTGTATLSSKAAIAGMGGIGKTSSALEYAHEALDNKAYNLIYWLLSETEDSLLTGYRDLLQDIGIPLKDEDDGQVVELIKKYVPNMGKCLLIYDNVPNPEFLSNKIPPNTHILITSRWNAGWEKPLNLDAFRPEESIKYLLNTIGLDETNLDHQEKAGKLADELCHFPLALSHAAHYIKLLGGNMVSGDTLVEYLENFKKASPIHFEDHRNPFKEDELEMTYENLIGKTFHMAQELISETAKGMMVYCSYLNPDSITEDIFIREGSDQGEIKEALKQLSLLSLIKREENGAAFSIHRLVQLIIQQEQESDQNRAQLSNHLNNLLMGFRRYYYGLKIDQELNKKNPFSSDQLYLSYSTVLSHLTSLCEHLRRLRESKKIGFNQSNFELYPEVLEYHFRHSLLPLRDEILERMKQVEPYNQGTISPQTLLQEEFKKAKLEMTEKELENILPLLPSNSKDRAAVIEALSKVDPAQRQDLVDNVKKLMTDDMDGKDRARIIEALSKVGPAQCQMVAASSRELMAEGMDGDDRARVIGAPRKVDPAELLMVSVSAKELMVEGMNGKDRARVIGALRKVDPAQCQMVAASSRELMAEGMDGEDQLMVIEALSKVDPAQRQDLVDNVKKLMTDDMNGYKRVKVIEVLNEVAPTQRQIFVDNIKELMTGGMDGDDRAIIIEVLGKVDPAQLLMVSVSAKELMTEGMDGKDRARIIEALRKVDPAQLLMVSLSAKELMTRGMDGDDRVMVIEALSKVDPNQRQVFVDNTKKLMTDDIRGYCQAIIIEALSKVDPDQRQVFVDNVKELMTDNIREYCRAIIIEALSKVDPDQRQVFVDNVKELMTGGMDGYNRVRIIQALSKVDPDQRQVFVDNVKELMTGGMNEYNWVAVIEALSKVDPDQRQAFVDNAKELMIEGMDGKDRARIIEVLRKLDPDQRQAFVDNVKELMAEGMDGDGRAIIIEALSKVEGTQCRVFIDNAKELMREDMDGYSPIRKKHYCCSLS